jgi:hypothetical protein
VWIWPLPPPGGLALVCELPAFGVALTRTEVEVQPILEAARRSLRVWV